jgi:uncharacterized protein YdeI (BOF family)
MTDGSRCATPFPVINSNMCPIFITAIGIPSRTVTICAQAACGAALYAGKPRCATVRALRLSDEGGREVRGLSGTSKEAVMKTQRWMVGTSMALGLTGMLALAGPVAAESGKQAGDQGNKPSAFGRTGNQGEGFGEDQTIKGKAPESTPQQDAQITLGGARPTVMGEVLKVDGDQYTVRDESGSEVRFRITKDTDTSCAGGQGEASVGRQGQSQGDRMGDQSGTQSRSSMGKDSGGDTAKGGGFAVGPKGGCAFKAGDRIKAEMSDLGTALFVKRLSEGKGNQ